MDLIHAPSYTGPLLTPVPVVLTVHDISYAVHPEWSPTPIGSVRQWYYRQSARRATRILTDSTFSAAEIARVYGIPAAAIDVSPLGVEAFFVPGDPSLPIALPARVSAPYVLHVGDLHERRNLAVVVAALIAARRHFGAAAGLSLVLVGVDHGMVDPLLRMAREDDFADSIVWLGSVSEDQLRSLYRGAQALVYPSRYEGFGLPLVEAMACGTPVIAANCASIPEVVGDAGVLLDPDDTAGWTEAIVAVANDEHRRERLRAAGLARASAFTWERTAQVTLSAYASALHR